MTMTPEHILEHGHGVAAAGLIIAIHIAAVYLPAPLSGWIGQPLRQQSGRRARRSRPARRRPDRGARPGTSLVALAIALALLGVGWNIGLLRGTTALAGALDPATRARTQGRVDVAVALGGAAGGFGSGLMVATSSYAALALTGGLLGVATLTAAAIVERRRATAFAATT